MLRSKIENNQSLILGILSKTVLIYVHNMLAKNAKLPKLFSLISTSMVLDVKTGLDIYELNLHVLLSKKDRSNYLSHSEPYLKIFSCS